MSFKNFGTMPKSLGTQVRNVYNNTRSTVGGFLSKIFFAVLEKRIFVDLKRIDNDKTFFERWNSLVISYLQDPKNAIPQDKQSISAARGNLKKEIVKPNMSWKVWVKAMRFLQITKIEFYFKFHLQNNKIIEHNATMNIGDIYITDKDDVMYEEEKKQPTEVTASIVPDNILG